MVVLTFQLLLDYETVIFFFLVFFNFYFFLCRFLSYFLDVFFASLLSLTHSPPTLPPLPSAAPDKRAPPFVLLQTIRSIIRAFLAYAKSTGCFLV